MNKMTGLLKNTFRYILLCMVKYVPGAQKAYDEAVAYYFRLLLERCLPPMSSGLFFIPDNIKTQKMCERAIEDEPRSLALVPNHLKTQGLCIKAVEACPWLLKYVPDWILTQEQVKLWHGYDYYCNNEFIKWYEGYQKRMAQKASIKEELSPIAWHPSRWWGWCVPEDEKKTEKLWR